jgi:hypothetical protein
MNVSSLSLDKPGFLPGAGQSVHAARARVGRGAAALASLIFGCIDGAG